MVAVHSPPRTPFAKRLTIADNTTPLKINAHKYIRPGIDDPGPLVHASRELHVVTSKPPSPSADRIADHQRHDHPHNRSMNRDCSINHRRVRSGKAPFEL
jgi:hypothetical protein